MTDRERLLQILNVPIHPHLDVDPLEAVADYLLDNGVTFASVDYGWPIFGESVRLNKGSIEDAKRVMLDNLVYAVRDIFEQYDCFIVETVDGVTSVGWKIALPVKAKEGTA
ncbi:MAG: hypothetical protein J6V25_10365 [Oscillospiraceae bacterium]|nr:hypothetical protein [Oscillospiraceae bacterium]